MLLNLLSEQARGKRRPKIEIKHPEVLEIPENKKFWQMPLKHFIALAKKKGYAPIARALTNLEVWNRKKHPEIAERAKNIRLRLKNVRQREGF